jgi:hypothetical protein
VPGPRAPFAVSPSGRAAFLTDNGGNELDIWFCGSSCGLGSSWTRVPLASTYVYAEGVAFGPDDSLQLIARHTVRNQESVVWYDCSGDCSSAASWAGLDNLWVAQGQFQAQVRGVLARTAQGGTRILFSSGDLVAPADQRVFGYLACDSSCRSAQSWKQPLQAPISGAAATVGFGFALDRAGQPAVATLNDFGAAFWRCTGDCTSVGAQWSAAPVVTVSDLNSFLPPTVPAGCLSASWGMYVGPDLAFDPVGKPVITLTANVKALGGDCGTGSAAITTDSFIYSNSL